MAKKKTVQEQKDTANRDRTLIPKEWPRHAVEATGTGFKNPNNLCYRNVTFQMLMHAPVFLNWVNWYKEHHAAESPNCKSGEHGGPCKICLFHYISTPYWQGGEEKTRLDSCNKGVTILSRQVWRAWGRGGKEGSQEEDSPEYFEHLYDQLLQDTKPMFKQDLRDIFEIKTRETKTCDGPCAPEAQTEATSNFLRLCLPGNKHSSIEDAIARFCALDNSRGTCNTCKGPRYYQQSISQLPEMLLVQLNRQYTKGKKIYQQIDLKNLVIDKQFMDSSADVEYELTSVLIYLRSEASVKGGHYLIAAKGKAGLWSYLNDDQEIEEHEEKAFQAKIGNRRNCYVFAYRRLPIGEKTIVDPKESKAQGNTELATDMPANIQEVDTNSTEFKGMITSILDQYRALDKKEWEERKKERNKERKKEWMAWADERDENTRKRKFAEELGSVPDSRAVRRKGDQKESKEKEEEQGEIVEWENQRGLLRITLQGETRTLDLQVQGKAFNNLKTEVKKKRIGKRIGKLVDDGVNKAKETVGRKKRK